MELSTKDSETQSYTEISTQVPTVGTTIFQDSDIYQCKITKTIECQISTEIAIRQTPERPKLQGEIQKQSFSRIKPERQHKIKMVTCWEKH